MTTLREISQKTGVGIWTLRKLKKAGYIRAEDENAEAQRMRSILSKQRPLSVADLITLIADPTIMYDLGRYSETARSQVAALGAVEATAAPREVVAYVDDAANGRPEAVAVIGDWLRSVIPPHKVSHAWIATRLVWNSHANLRPADIARAPLALIAARKEIPGWWRVEKIAGRNQTFYEKPKIPLDL